MILRLLEKDQEMKVHMRVDRAIHTEGVKLEVRIIDDEKVAWKTFMKGRDYQTFSMNSE